MHHRPGLWPAVALTLALAGGARAEVTLPSVIGSNMVLQRGVPVPIWGWAAPGETVTVTLERAKATATADKEGRWSVKLPAHDAGGPHEMTVVGRNTITLTNVLFGEVWVCSGQSNMSFPLASSTGAAVEIAGAERPRMRLFTMPRRAATQPMDDSGGQWLTCSSQTAPPFSAVAYYFGKELQKGLGQSGGADIPIGIIHASWSGTLAESWTPVAALETDPILQPITQRYAKSLAALPRKMDDYRRQWAQYSAKAGDPPANTGLGQGWAAADFDPSAWKDMNLPGFWKNSGVAHDGVVWFRREVQIPPAWAGQDLELSLGPIHDLDNAYFDGVQVGATGKDTPDFWNVVRRYTVPAKAVKAGRAVVAVRVFNYSGFGGLYGGVRELTLNVAGGAKATALPLAGSWKFRVEEHADAPAALGEEPALPIGPDGPYAPSCLFNGMVHPLTPYAIRGVVWYQGEGNSRRAFQYRTLLPTLIKEWRQAWVRGGQGDFPFLVVQLPNFSKAQENPDESAWAELREAQWLAARNTPNVHLAVAIDLGAADNLHPPGKAEVGRRLALTARGAVYGQDVVFSGPAFTSMKVEDSAVRLTFAHVGGGLAVQGGSPLKGFAVAGEDRKFVWAQARIVEGTVLVQSDQAPRPVAVRYAWGDNPPGNLSNKEGLPALPFRTDDFPMKSADAR